MDVMSVIELVSEFEGERLTGEIDGINGIGNSVESEKFRGGGGDGVNKVDVMSSEKIGQLESVFGEEDMTAGAERGKDFKDGEVEADGSGSEDA